MEREGNSDDDELCDPDWRLGAEEEAEECANKAKEEAEDISLKRLLGVAGETAPRLAVE